MRGGIATFTKSNLYLYSFFSFGGFYARNSFKQGALNIYLGLYTPLFNLGRWYIRQFINLRSTSGLERYKVKYVDLNDQVFGISKIKEDKRLTVNIESVFFRPLSFYGFQIAYYGFLHMAAIGTSMNLVRMNEFFASFGGGIRLRNEGLIIQTIDIRRGYIPRLPNGGSSFIYSFSGSDPSQVKLLSIGKPEVVSIDKVLNRIRNGYNSNCANGLPCFFWTPAEVESFIQQEELGNGMPSAK